MKTSILRKFTHDEMHDMLLRATCSMDAAEPDRQAFLCPYYVRLTGVLATDWGVIVSPESSRFGRLVFEHDDCGCGPGAHGAGRQRTDEWRDRKRERREAK